jgi:beta-lactamase class A
MRFVTLALIAACNSAPTPPPPVVAAPPPVVAAPTRTPAPAKPSFPNVPATAPGDQLAWVLDVLVHRQGKVEPAELEAHFHPTFLAAVPTAELVRLFAQLAEQFASVTIGETKGDELHLVAHAIIGPAKLTIDLKLDAASGKMSGLLFRPDLDPALKPTSFEDAQTKLAALAPHASLYVASLDRGTCKPLHALEPKVELAIGSAFKLYVLLGLADQMIAGKLTWDGKLAVRDSWKSLPSGITQDDPGGTELTIQTLAERMISISDNTATDHLLYTVGRKNVEAALREAKHAKPALDTPFLGTRELFLLKLGTADERTAYLALPEAKRRAWLDQTFADKRPSLAGAAAWKTARQIDKLEWFASGEDMCRVMGTLWTRAQDPKAAPLLGVLAKNPGIPIDAKAWPYTGFKGGSEPGVLDLTFLLRRADDRWFVVSLTANANEDGAVAEDQLIPIASGVIELLAHS